MRPSHSEVVSAFSTVGTTGVALIIRVVDDPDKPGAGYHYRVALAIDATEYRSVESAASSGIAQLTSVNRALYGPLRPGIEGGT